VQCDFLHSFPRFSLLHRKKKDAHFHLYTPWRRTTRSAAFTHEAREARKRRNEGAHVDVPPAARVRTHLYADALGHVTRFLTKADLVAFVQTCASWRSVLRKPRGLALHHRCDPFTPFACKGVLAQHIASLILFVEVSNAASAEAFRLLAEHAPRVQKLEVVLFGNDVGSFDVLAQLPLLAWLRLYGTTGTAPVMRALLSMTALRHVELESIDDAGVALVQAARPVWTHLFIHTQMPHATWSTLGDALDRLTHVLMIPDSGDACGPSLTQRVQKLQVRRQQHGAFDAFVSTQLGTFAQLHTLLLWTAYGGAGSRMTSAQLALAFAGMQCLTDLTLEAWPCVDDFACLVPLSALTRLQLVRVNVAPGPDAQLPPTLTDLTLDSCRAVRNLSFLRTTALQRVRMTNMHVHVTGHNLHVLASLTHATHLRLASAFIRRPTHAEMVVFDLPARSCCRACKRSSFDMTP
jgi:hypothetical protein